MVQIKTRNNGEINIRVLLIQISNRMLCHMPQEFTPFCFFLRCKEHVPRTAYLITTDRRPRCTKDRDRASSKPGHSERAAIRSSSPRAAAFTRPSEAGAYFFYPRSSNYGLALESNKQGSVLSRGAILSWPARRGGEPGWTHGPCGRGWFLRRVVSLRPGPTCRCRPQRRVP